ncbi:hypothetical protein CEY12_15475 [Chryseobacterium sp. T16E-39]|nr:hypothetical protein CEY12_15475 [Chryseobacterium sp. T16E-39]
MNSPLINAGQPEICSTHKTPNMETPNHNPDIIFDTDLYTIEWSDIENVEIDYENYLDDIELFFKEDFDNEILEGDIYL